MKNQDITPMLGEIPNHSAYSANCLCGKSLRIMLDAGRTLEIQFLEPGDGGVIDIAVGLDREDGSCQDICVQRVGKDGVNVLLPGSGDNSESFEEHAVPFAPPPILEFRGANAFLSNFHEGGIEYDGLSFRSAESAFQAAKTLDMGERQKFVNLSASEAKRLGRRVTLRPDWESVKEDIMLGILRAKFAPGSGLAKRLLDTGEATLVEGNRWHDNYWGTCLCQRCAGKARLNRLGKLLEQVREELRNTPIKQEWSRLPTCQEWDTLLRAVGESDELTHWRNMYSWCQDKDLHLASHRAVRGYPSARYWGDFSATHRYVRVGFRPAFDVLDSDILGPDGTVIMAGTLYMNDMPVKVPQNPISIGDIPDYIPGAKLELGAPIQDAAYQVQAIKIGNIMIADRVLLKNISWDDLHKQGFC